MDFNKNPTSAEKSSKQEMIAINFKIATCADLLRIFK